MGFYKDYLMEKTVDELKEYRRKQIKNKAIALILSSILYFVLGCVFASGFLDEKGMDYAVDMAMMFFAGTFYCGALNLAADILLLNRRVREKERKNMETFYAGVTE